MTRHTYFNYPENENTKYLNEQIMIGGDLVFAPVMNSG